VRQLESKRKTKRFRPSGCVCRYRCELTRCTRWNKLEFVKSFRLLIVQTSAQVSAYHLTTLAPKLLTLNSNLKLNVSPASTIMSSVALDAGANNPQGSHFGISRCQRRITARCQSEQSASLFWHSLDSVEAFQKFSELAQVERAAM